MVRIVVRRSFDLANVPQRTLVMFSDDDLVTMTHVVETYDALPNAELAVVPGTSHFLTQEKPAHSGGDRGFVRAGAWSARVPGALTLLGLLPSRAGETVAVDRLADELWDADPARRGTRPQCRPPCCAPVSDRRRWIRGRTMSPDAAVALAASLNPSCVDETGSAFYRQHVLPLEGSLS